MHISIVSSRHQCTHDWLPRKLHSFLNQGNLPKSTLSTLSIQQANLFTTNKSFQKTYKTQSFSQHECSGMPRKLIDVHQNTNANSTNTKTVA